ncbi:MULTISPECIES: MarR family transcriptional regulator [Luteimonas]|uniref:MarR family winged helix-turn-helix transcriptional regulator n=1 Tax=Luteimonas cellulosilyticus TaxID=2683586 RepID=UPI000C7BE4B3
MTDELAELIALCCAFDQHLRKRLKRSTRDVRRYLVLAHLQTRDNALPRDLAKVLRASSSTVSTVVKGLEKDGLIQRESRQDTFDHRYTRIRITEAGLTALAEAVDDCEGLSATLFAVAGKGDDAFRHRLMMLTKALDSHKWPELTKP